jgi:hypothetical protein
MRQLLIAFAHVSAGAALLLVLPLANGRPSLFGDTKAYFVLGEQIAEKIAIAKPGQSVTDLAASAGAEPQSEGGLKERVNHALTVAATRSPYYGFYLFALAHLGTFWLVAAIQACLAAWLIFVFSRAASPSGGIKLYYANIALAAFLSTLPLFVGFMSPDIAAGLGVLAAASLTLFPERISTMNKLALGALILFSLLCHPTHKFLIGAVACAGFFGLRFAGVTANIAARRALILIALVVAGGLGWSAYRASAKLIYHEELRSPPFLTARLLEDGPGRDYLRSACAANPAAFELCRFQDRPLDNAETILWVHNPDTGVFGQADNATRVRLIEEQWRFVWGVLRFAPVSQIAASTRNFVRELMRFRVDDITDASEVMADPEFAVLRRMLPGSEPCWTQPGLCASALPDKLLGWVTGLVFVLSLALSIAIAGWNLNKHRTGSKRAAALLGIMVLALIVNAAVCGIFSGPFARYQTRITWLFPLTFTAILALCRYQRPSPAAGRAGRHFMVGNTVSS